MHGVFLNGGILDSLVIFFLIIVCVSVAFRCHNPNERPILLSTMHIYIAEHLHYCDPTPNEAREDLKIMRQFTEHLKHLQQCNLIAPANYVLQRC